MHLMNEKKQNLEKENEKTRQQLEDYVSKTQK